MARKSLSEILHADQQQRLSSAWNTTQAAEEFAPLPAGEYVARVEAGEPATSKTKGTPSYKLTFRVVEGQYAGRLFWHDLWLTPAALPMTKRDLAKFGVTSLDQLDKPFPQGIVCRVKLALRKDDDDGESNKVKSFTVERIETPQVDPFAPADPPPTAEPPQEPAGGAA